MDSNSETQPEKKKGDMSPEMREKLSRLAKQRHAEGKFGGSQYGRMGGRRRKDRVAKRVAEAAQEDATARYIIQVFKDAVDPTQPISVRLKAAEAWIGVEREEAKVSMQEIDHSDKKKSREELIAALSKGLTEGPAATAIQRQLDQNVEPDLVDAEVIEEDG